jgi:hypothetical protein
MPVLWKLTNPALRRYNHICRYVVFIFVKRHDCGKYGKLGKKRIGGRCEPTILCRKYTHELSPEIRVGGNGPPVIVAECSGTR